MTATHKVAVLSAALRTARRVLWQDRTRLWCDCTIEPVRSWGHMNKDEKRAIQRLDRAVIKIDKALKEARKR